ncbi:MAG: nuclear transport factor 2 family protein [Myxococcales bacterium]
MSTSRNKEIAAELFARFTNGDLKNGRRYRQQYHFRIEFRDGQIVRVHEYLDTQHAFEVWMRP